MESSTNPLEVGEEFAWLVNAIKERANSLLSKEDIDNEFTSHGQDHSLRILNSISMICSDRIVLSPWEVVVLTGAAYLHDIALTAPEEVIPLQQRERGWYWHDMRRIHGEHAANYIRRNLWDLLVFSEHQGFRVRDNTDLIEAIAILCDCHTSEFTIEEKCAIQSKRLSRLPLLAYLLVLGDELDAGFPRIRLAQVLKSDLPAVSKELWLARSTIVDSRIIENRVCLYMQVPKDIAHFKFIQSVAGHLKDHLKPLLGRARKIFTRFCIRPLLVHVTVKPLQTQEDKELPQLLPEVRATQRKMRQRKSSWYDKLHKKTIGDGAFSKGTIGDELLILRRWGSSTHRLFCDRRGTQRGGGYFLSWNGCGTAIDPGYDYITNMFSMRNLAFTMRDIQGGLITHAHDDHTHDLEPIVSLQYRLRRGVPADSLQFSEFPIVCSEGVRWKFAPMMASNDFLKLLPFVPTKNGRRQEAMLPRQGEPIPFFSSVGIQFKFMLSYHPEAPWHLNNTGAVTKIYCSSGTKTFCIGYTGDTGFEPGIVTFLKDADIVLCHVGNRVGSSSPYPEHHLGFAGVHDLISALKIHRPRLFLLGEFGADEFISGRTDDRIRFTQQIETMSGAQAVGKRVLPADVGLRIRIPDVEVWCENVPTLYTPTGDNLSGNWVPPTNVQCICLPGHEIHYLT